MAAVDEVGEPLSNNELFAILLDHGVINARRKNRRVSSLSVLNPAQIQIGRTENDMVQVQTLENSEIWVACGPRNRLCDPRPVVLTLALGAGSDVGMRCFSQSSGDSMTNCIWLTLANTSLQTGNNRLQSDKSP